MTLPDSNMIAYLLAAVGFVYLDECEDSHILDTMKNALSPDPIAYVTPTDVSHVADMSVSTDQSGG